MATRRPLMATVVGGWFLFLAPGSGACQVEGLFRGTDGLLHYDWINATGAGARDTLEVGHLLINTSDSVLAAPFQGCDLEIETSADVHLIDERCSEWMPSLAPGDSLWGTRRWEVSAGAEEYLLGIRVGASTSAPRPRRIQSADAAGVPAVEPRSRMTAVVRFSAPTGPSIVTKADIEDLIHEVVWESGRLPVLSTEVAADAAADGVPYLVVDITIDESVGHADPGRILRYVVATCWRNAAGQAARATCPRANATMSGSSSVTLLALRLARVIKQELEWLGHVHEP